MPRLKGFPGLIIKPEWVEKVTTGPYDSYTPEQRRGIISDNSLSFLNITRSLEDLPPTQHNDIEGLLNDCKESMEHLYKADVYQSFDTPSLFIYRIDVPYDGSTHSQTGIVGLVPVEDTESLQILKHEEVRPERSDLMSRHLLAVEASSSPISLTYKNDQYLSAAIGSCTLDEPVLTTENNEMKQTIWKVSGEAAEGLSKLVNEKTLYITDGHHRMAAAEEALNSSNGNYEPLKWTQAVLFPDDEMLVLPFHRRVGDLEGRNSQDILNAISTVCEIKKSEDALPEQIGEVGVYLDGECYRMLLPESNKTNLVDQLDVARLQEHILSLIFEVRDPGTHKLIDYVPGPLGQDVVKERCDVDSWVAFLMHPLRIEDLMEVAEAGELMPPKSSYLMPKPRSGVFVRDLSRENNI
jgi:uncharacterized protein (DUF1015 family)